MNIIKEYRHKRGITQKQLAEMLDVTPISVIRYEAGRVPEEAILKKLCDVSDGYITPNKLYGVGD